MQALLFRSHDVRSLALLGATCVVGFLVACPSPALVRVVFVCAATAGVAAWILARHNAVEDVGRRDDRSAGVLMDRGPDGGPFAMLLHPEASSAIASLSVLSGPGRRANVHAVVVATENVVRAYHAILGAPAPHPGRGTAGSDDLRDLTVVALDALQGLRMDTGSRGRASSIAAAAERRLRRLFVRFRQIAGNKLKSHGAPFPFDPKDDHRYVR